ncbi:hypothetical protein J2I47_24135 [Fibrella sp. HMF5335]|uniref:Tetratricopeptide repeat protein n=1 Tax=Fibrella rubiginis TaxID=2817060 RepID=A0A939GMQ7_9BACT|nr:hypothetical protein [Fibrella rubiginis]MBO0939660.1 hypothetical protein [Fibrella rubiginis]
MVLLVRLALFFVLLPSLGSAVVGDSVLSGTFLAESKLGLISRRNQARKQANIAYRQGRYEQALAQFRTVLETGQPVSAVEHLAVAHMYFRLHRFRPASYHYGLVSGSVTPAVFSIASAQLGVLACYRRDTATALSQFQRALLSDPENKAARLNYEWLKPRYSGKKRQPKPQKKAATAQQEVSQQVEKTEQQQAKLNPFRNVNMTEEQARRLLDALQNDDLPYALARRRQLHRSSAGTAGRW